MNILLCAVGSVAAQPALKALKKQKHKVIGCDIYPKEWVYRSDKFAKFYQVPPALDSNFPEVLLDIAKAEKIKLIIPLIDLECDVLAPRKAEFAEQGIRIACLDEPLQTLCRDKVALPNRLAALCNIIPTYDKSLTPVEPYPYILKPRSGRSSQHQVKVHNEEELRFFCKLREDYILQPFLEGCVYTVDCVRDSQGHTLCFSRKELLRTVNGLGTSVQMFKKHPLQDICSNILKELELVGCVNMEFIEHNGQYYFLELNPRFSGGLGFSQMAGYDFVTAHVQAHLGEAISLKHKKKDALLVQGYKKIEVQ